MTAITIQETSQIQAVPSGNDFAQRVETACQSACDSIAPVWPLDRSIAVNPHWGRISSDVRTVAARLAVLGGIQVFPSRKYIQNAWSTGRITPEDLSKSIAQKDGQASAIHCVADLKQEPNIQRQSLLIDLLEMHLDGESRFSWRHAVTHQISQTCAAYFDTQQADWKPKTASGLYGFWRETISHDRGIGVLMGLPDFSECLEQLPSTALQAEQWALRKFGLDQGVWADYLEALLLTVNGWASWCSYLSWQAKLEGTTNDALRELLAIRLAWGAILLDSCSPVHAEAVFKKLRSDWNQAPEKIAAAKVELEVDEIWQLALELGYQRELASSLSGNGRASLATPNVTGVKAQAVFCIDVRSERIRRAIETVDPSIRTKGFAGFFGLPIAYKHLGSSSSRPQLPGLLPPSLTVSDEIVFPDGVSLQSERQSLESLRTLSFLKAEQWESLSRWPGSSFSFVESFGMAFAGKLSGWLRTKVEHRTQDDYAGIPMRLRPVCRPELQNVSVEQRVAICAQVLTAMGLKSGFAPLVLLVGHGSQSANNPHAAGLDCGACGGQTGEVNARVLARLLNESDVRAGLLAKGIEIPSANRFVAALHNTTTDELEWFDTDLLTDGVRTGLADVQKSFRTAQQFVRMERAPSLGIDPLKSPAELLNIFKQRASDGAQTRPEWALAGNASFLMGPRALSQDSRLGGRAFLHDYEWRNDTDGSVLELLMTAPMLVTNWINWQYHASLCEPRLYGSGNKVLHNVVGGNIGVFEGNGGDLRQGLSKQSLHDGTNYLHEPLRLTVVICAPQSKIFEIVQKHEVLQNLIYNGWMHLWQMDGGQIFKLSASGWTPALGAMK
ncbi:hypothetical protein AEP_02984 [Curvibacter sp. AEP1-3]|uniref:YbcC family protein n=1 Tax=Curvibacter sp. AEP1-3 TaxID=1844971 RepID=UPI000B3C0EFD|nr:DUF2309 domain-containing protein [Curvibacter sp. AEP1-3]ARV19909.1 hypothetical protein AEP_02984 [Curvibacter sp. AEP1-3]